MNPIFYKIGSFLLLSSLIGYGEIFAEEQHDEMGVLTPDKNEFVDSLEIGVEFATNYIDRGENIYRNRALQRGTSFTSVTGVPVMIPSFVLNTALDGLYFEGVGFFAMQGRNDVDYDHRFQRYPEGESIPGEVGSVWEREFQAARIDNYLTPECRESATSPCLPGFYDEEVGLKRADNIELTVGYDHESHFGFMGFGVTFATSPNPVGKSDAGTTEEVFVYYGFPFLSELSISFASEVDSAVDYLALIFEKEYIIVDDLSVGVMVNGGYGIDDRFQGWKDVTGSISLSFLGFFIGANAAYRPNLRFFDDDSYGNNSGQLSVWTLGQSSNTDGLVVDPGRTYGYMNEFTNNLIQTEMDSLAPGYVFTPRQKLPRTLYWLNVGYSYEF